MPRILGPHSPASATPQAASLVAQPLLRNNSHALQFSAAELLTRCEATRP